MQSPPGGPKRRDDGRRRRRRGPREPERAQAPAEVVARAEGARPLLAGKSAEEPLSPEELGELKQQLRFLKEHRRALQLRVNAHEDLLLNGAREPERRGVCQHLLAKVDRARVHAAAERLDPAAATRLAEGVLRIAPSLDYLLLYLECVRRSASARHATSALVRALTSIDFSAVSPGQMRRVLDLVVELYSAHELPQILFGLLEGRAFREAFDAAATELPEALASLVVPIRAVGQQVLRGEPSRFGPEALARGVQLLLEGDAATLLAYPPHARRRLAELGAASGAALEAHASASLAALVDSLAGEERERLGLELARALIGAEREKDAARLLRALDTKPAKRWLDDLALPRRERFALIGDAKRERVSAVHLGTMRLATVYAGEPPLALHVPSVAALLGEGTLEGGARWYALERPGRPLSSLVARRPGVPRPVLVAACVEAARLLASLAALGLALPDARLARFELDRTDRLWLTDTSGVSRDTPGAVELAHLELVRSFCRDVLAGSVLSPAILEALARAATATAAAAALERAAF